MTRTAIPRRVVARAAIAVAAPLGLLVLAAAGWGAAAITYLAASVAVAGGVFYAISVIDAETRIIREDHNV